MYGGSSISDEELMFRVQVDEEMRKKLQPPVEYRVGDSRVVSLVQAIVRAGKYRHIHLSRPGLTLTMGRGQPDEANGAELARPQTKAGDPAGSS